METVIFAVGGTGGHIFPAKVLASKLKQKGIKPIFAGHALKKNPFVFSCDVDIYDVTSAPLTIRNPLKLLKAIFSYFKGLKEAVKLICHYHPKLIIGFGSYHSFPLLLAAKLKKIPYVLYESNCVLGKINRIFSRGALFCSYQLFDLEKKGYGRFIKVNMVTHQNIAHEVDKVSALRYFGLKDHCFTLLVFGGSQGSMSINHIFLETIKKLRDVKFQVIHLIGKNTDLHKVKALYDHHHISSCVKEFEDNMHYAYLASDCMIARSGALSVFEQIIFEIPAIYIPLPWASDKHQLKNALFVEKKLKAAKVIQQQNLTPEIMALAVKDYVERPDLLNKIKSSIKAFNESEQHENCLTLLEQYLFKRR